MRLLHLQRPRKHVAPIDDLIHNELPHIFLEFSGESFLQLPVAIMLIPLVFQNVVDKFDLKRGLIS